MALTTQEFQRNFAATRVDRYQARPKDRAMGMTPERLAAFATLVSEGRKRFKSRSAFCEIVGITRTTLRALESGSQQPTLETIEKIAKALGTTPDALTGVVPIAPNPNPLLKDLSDEDLWLANRYHHLDAEAKRAVKIFLSPGVSNADRERIAIVLDLLLRSKDDMLPAVEDLLTAWDADVRAEESTDAPPEKKSS